MAKVIVEPRNGKYVAYQNTKNNIITWGKTQKETGDKAHQIKPHELVQGARVRTTAEGKRDQFRTLHKPIK